jgi:hypothetical protein
MAGFMPAIHDLIRLVLKPWMAATSAAMTREFASIEIGRHRPPWFGARRRKWRHFADLALVALK